MKMSDLTFLTHCISLCFLFVFLVTVNGEQCGPLGYNAKELLKPPYWYFDFAYANHSFPGPPPNTGAISIPNPKITARIYFHICKSMIYQCSGTICMRYMNTDDYVVILGKEKSRPFTEVGNYFETDFMGDTSLCKKRGAKFGSPIKTNLRFVCDPNTKWNISEIHVHGGAKSPDPVKIEFLKTNCEVNIHFNYTGACSQIPSGSLPGKSMSIGSILLILFFPGLVLYFIVGILINKMAGHKGQDLIPHAPFWISLPDLIMEGFVFSMAVITCRNEETRVNYDQV